MYKLHTTCRACGSTNLEQVADFGIVPLANDFKKLHEEREGFAPLSVLLCERCSLAQLSVVVKPEVLYSNYSYVSSTSKTMLDHMRLLIHDIKQRCHAGTMVEIGSNTGVLLSVAKDLGFERIHGIDPAANLAALANENGIPTTVGVFNRQSALECDVRGADVVVARHVFAHVNDWEGFINTLDIISNDKTLVVIEVPYVGDMLDGDEWDSVYHEHLSFVNIKSINALLAKTKWMLQDAKRYSIHGGSIALFLRRRDGVFASVMDDEFSASDFISSARRWKAKSALLMSELIRGPRKMIFGYGAPAKATLWINYLELNSSQISFVHDETPQKQGRFMPGTDIPVIDGRYRMKDFDTGIVFAWNFADEILAKEKWFTDKGGKFIVPIHTPTK